MYQLNMLWGVRPQLFTKAKNERELVEELIRQLLENGSIKKENTILVVAGKISPDDQVQLTELRRA